MPLASAEGDFLCLFSVLSSILLLEHDKGGVPMDDEEIYEMFLELIEQLDLQDPDGRIRVLSKLPRYTTEEPTTQQMKPKYIER